MSIVAWHGWLWIKGQWECVSQHHSIDEAHARLLHEARKRHLLHSPRELTQGSVPPQPAIARSAK